MVCGNKNRKMQKTNHARIVVKLELKNLNPLNQLVLFRMCKKNPGFFCRGE